MLLIKKNNYCYILRRISTCKKYMEYSEVYSISLHRNMTSEEKFNNPLVCSLNILKNTKNIFQFFLKPRLNL